MIQDCKCLGKNCVFFISGFNIGLIDFFEIHFIVFDGQPIIPNNNMLYFKLLIGTLVYINILLDKFCNPKNILLNFVIELSLKDPKDIFRTEKAVSIFIKKEKRDYMWLPDFDFGEPFINLLKLIKGDVSSKLVKVLLKR